MFAEGKITEIFFMADEFCNFFTRMMGKDAVEDSSMPQKRKYHRDSTMSDAESMAIMMLFRNCLHQLGRSNMYTTAIFFEKVALIICGIPDFFVFLRRFSLEKCIILHLFSLEKCHNNV